VSYHRRTHLGVLGGMLFKLMLCDP
jgi:hypothetical protein